MPDPAESFVSPEVLLIALAVVTLLLVITIVVRPNLTDDRGGKTLAFAALFLMPGLVGVFGAWDHLEHSKSTAFCLSCHVMEPYGESLAVDDPTYLAASHFQNNRVPPDQACYSCHTEYTMYGDMAAKWRGLRHVYAYYLGRPPEATSIQLYEPYHNRECLYCHSGARSFEEFPLHGDPEMMTALETNETSCLVCHDLAHGVGARDTAWRDP